MTARQHLHSAPGAIPAIFFLLFLPLAGTSLPAQQEPESLEEIRSKFEFSLDVTRGDFDVQRKNLGAKYLEALNRLQAEFQKAGNLDGVLAAREAHALFEKTSKPGSSENKRITALRMTLIDALDTIERKESATINSRLATHTKYLNTIKTQCTRTGDIDRVIAIERELERLATTGISSRQPRRSTTLPIAMNRPATNPPTDLWTPIDPLPTRTAPKNMFRDGLTITEPVVLPPGVYTSSETVTLAKADPSARGAGILLIQPGSEIRGGRIMIQKAGRTHADQTHFKDATILANLNGVFSADSCLFDQCTLNKGGNWFTRMFSSKWRLQNCVFNGSFIPKIQGRRHGVKLRNCTFDDVNLLVDSFVIDPAEEAVRPERTIEACHFINCTVSPSFLICTTNCLFENCSFTDLTAAPIPSHADFPIQSPLTVTLYVAGTKPPYTRIGNHITLIVKPPSDLPSPAGAALK